MICSSANRFFTLHSRGQTLHHGQTSLGEQGFSSKQGMIFPIRCSLLLHTVEMPLKFLAQKPNADGTRDLLSQQKETFFHTALPPYVKQCASSLSHPFSSLLFVLDSSHLQSLTTRNTFKFS